eukprot:2590543-Prymnesium_polylepis.1
MASLVVCATFLLLRFLEWARGFVRELHNAAARRSLSRTPCPARLAARSSASPPVSSSKSRRELKRRLAGNARPQLVR